MGGGSVCGLGEVTDRRWDLEGMGGGRCDWQGTSVPEGQLNLQLRTKIQPYILSNKLLIWRISLQISRRHKRFAP